MVRLEVCSGVMGTDADLACCADSNATSSAGSLSKTATIARGGGAISNKAEAALLTVRFPPRHTSFPH
jgi:hypothetical protein